MSLIFKKSPIRNGLYIHQSPWIYDLYNHFFKNKHDGYLVELGVGHVLDWNSMNSKPKILTSNEFEKTAVRGWSNTLELIENGWSGIYIDPIEEFITNELEPLVHSLIPKENYNKVKMICIGASDKEYIAKIVKDETINIISEDLTYLTDEKIIPYNYKNRLVKCKKTSDILIENNCPENIDVMSIDVEGHEFNAIKGIDFNLHKPKLLIVETDKVPTEQIQSIIPSNYKLIIRDYLNSAFLRD